MVSDLAPMLRTLKLCKSCATLKKLHGEGSQQSEILQARMPSPHTRTIRSWTIRPVNQQRQRFELPNGAAP